MNSQEPNRLTGSRFVRMCLSNWFLHLYIFLTIPLMWAQSAALPGGVSLIGWVVLSFTAGMLLPGPFGARLMERHSRKSIFLRALLVAGPLCMWGYAHAFEGWHLCLFYALQGAAYGIAQTALGTTMVNDLLLSCQRSRGDFIYAWAGRIGIPLGLCLGYVLLAAFPLSEARWWALLPCLLAFLVIVPVAVPLKAPVKVSMLSLDRFFLPRSLPLSLTMFAAPWVMGRLAAVYTPGWSLAVSFLCMSIGALVMSVLRHTFDYRPDRRLLVSAGYLWLMAALVLIALGGLPWQYIGYGFVGCGTVLITSCHLKDWVSTAGHCQRGTAQNTYLISWHIAFSLGFVAGCLGCLPGWWPDALLCLATIAFYVLWVYPHTPRIVA